MTTLMRYVRLFADPDGQSHFEDVEVPVTTDGAGAELSSMLAATGVIFRRVASGQGSAESHVAPRRQLVVHLEGDVEVEASDGETRRFGPGSVVLVEDTSGHGHSTRSLDGRDRTTLFIPLATEEIPA